MPVSVAIGIALIFYVGYRLYQFLFPPPNINPSGKYVLITGCDTGFGHALAIDLDKQGFHVFAGVYKLDNGERVKSELSSRATVFSLDITQQAEIDEVYELVKEKTSTLHALINNAGISNGGLIDWTSMDFLRQTMEVNFYGQVQMTKKFLPLLISRRGSRVINLCSFAGYLAPPGISAYATSKYALEAFSDCLRREMHTWGLYVSIIEPSYMRTPYIEGREHKLLDVWNQVDQETRQRWGENYFHTLSKHLLENPFILNAENPQKVVKALRHAVMSSAPNIRYRPGWQSSLFFFPLSVLPAWIADYVLIKTKGFDIPPAALLEQQS